MPKSKYVPGELFHDGEHGVYAGELDRAVYKTSKHMARVVYEPVHENSAFEDERRGAGKEYAKWVFSEEPGLAEGIFESAFELMIDAELEPHAAIGLHEHHRTEEIYYVIEGSMKITTVGSDGQEVTHKLEAGDAHAIRRGQAHYGKAGKKGARFIAVAVRI